jgi:hypothetical protein
LFPEKQQGFRAPVGQGKQLYCEFRVFRTIAIIVGCCALSACVSQPDVYAPPAQRKPLDRELLARWQPFLEMDDPNADAHIVADILGRAPEVPWRWTRKRPEIEVALKSVSGFKYVMELAIADETFKDTGPVTVTYLVNGHTLESVTYKTPGQKTFEKAVPPVLLKEMGPNRLGAEIDKVWTSPSDRQPLGFIVLRMGLVQQ